MQENNNLISNEGEILDIYNENLEKIGSIPRCEVHKKGYLHQVVHCWLMSIENGEKYIYFQQRSFLKKDYPGLLDITSTGHIDSGEPAHIACVREMREETGHIVKPKELFFVGSYREYGEKENFFDNELANIYLYRCDKPSFNIGEEVCEMVKIKLTDYKKMAKGEINSLIGEKYSDKSNMEIKKEEFCQHFEEYLALVKGQINKGNFKC